MLCSSASLSHKLYRYRRGGLNEKKIIKQKSYYNWWLDSGICYFKLSTCYRCQDKIICSSQWSLNTFTFIAVTIVACKRDFYFFPQVIQEEMQRVTGQTEKQLSHLFQDCLTNTGFPQVDVLRSVIPLIPAAGAKLSPDARDACSFGCAAPSGC